MKTSNFSAVFFLLVFIGFKGFSQDPQQVGQWSPKIEFDIVPVAVANLPDGRLVTWSSKYHHDFGGDDGFTFTQIFDPLGGLDSLGGVLPRTVTDTNHDMFCPGINNLADGRILVSGGSSDEKSSIYDPRTEQWTNAGNLNIPRGYQGAVTLSDGSAFTIGGSWSGGPYGGRDAEIWTEATGWIELKGLKGELLWNANDAALEPEGTYRLDNHAWLFAAPNGKIFHAGPGETMHWFDVNGGNETIKGSFVEIGPRGDDTSSMNGNTVMFDIGKILKVGGSGSYSSGSVSNEKAYVIDINDDANVIVTRTLNDMQNARIYVTSVVLPNGEVLVLGGMENAVVFSDEGAHLIAEMFDPTTNLFIPLASMLVPRTYHSAGILLADGRVFMGGGGLCGDHCPANHKDAEIYSPPYLFNSLGELADRPSLNAPDNAFYERAFPVIASADVTEFAFLRMSTATHSINNEQRRIPVTFSIIDGYYHLNMPNANTMPPGYYMLFALNADGVPSISEAVLVSPPDLKIKENNLLVEYDFFEGSGALVMDTSGKDNHGTMKERDDNGIPIALTKNYWSTNGLSGNALEMDGKEHNSNSILEIPPSPALQGLTNKITVMAWVNRNEADNIPNVSIFAHDYPSFFIGYHGSQYKLEFYNATNGIFSCYTNERFTPLVWEHVVATYDGARAKLYVNGEKICDQPMSGDLRMNTSDEFFNTFTVSGFYERRLRSALPTGSNGSGISDELDGRMDKFKLYNIALTAQEISSIYNKERDVVNVEGPCDEVALEFELNGVRDGRRKEITVREGDTVGFFLDVEGIDYTVSDPFEVQLSDNVIENITQSGLYTVNFAVKKFSLAQNLVAIYASSEQETGQKAERFKAVDRDGKTFWHTKWSPLPKAAPPHEIHIDLGVSSFVSGLEYLPRQDNVINGTITNYQIYVSDSSTIWDTEPDAYGTWTFDRDLKTVNFPEKQGRYVRLVAISNQEKGASAAEIRIIKTDYIPCEKTLQINVEIPKTYTFNGAWSSGDPSGVSGQFDEIIIDSGNAVISENTICQSVTINPGASLSIEDAIGNTSVILTVKSGLTLNSTSMSFASLIDKGWLTGEVNYNRHVNVIGTSAGGGNDLISSPIEGANFDQTFVTINPKLAENINNRGEFAFAPYNVSSGAYENFNIGSDYSGKIPIISGLGYRAATLNGDSVIFKGRTTRNPVDIVISDAPLGKAWNLVGNPYPSYIDFNAFFSANAAEFDSRDAYQAIYGYTGLSNGWTVWNSATLAGAIATEVPQLIAPGQGFFVKSKLGGGIVKFMPEMRTTGTSDDFILGRQVKRNVALSKLKLRSGSKDTSTSIYFIEGSTKGLDSGYDAATFSGARVDFSIATSLLEDNTGLDMAIQSLPYDDFNDVIIPLGIKAKAGTELSISIDEGSTIPSNINVYLEDIQNNMFTLLNANAYTFDTTTNLNSAERFNVHYSSKTLSVDDMQSNDNLRIYTTVVPRALVIRGPLTSATTANLYDIQGRLVLSTVLNPYNTENTVDISRVSTGVYVVKVTTDNQFKTQKVIIK
ncbi:LamG-like jellyroll fold domain-containing protein [Gelidibacter algens]|nr:LamG-like jellyroll fold domain-containing protein [Gelidibacter algens]